jgi:hypothetical protein
MSIKKYFEIAGNIKSLSNKSADEIASQIESVAYHEQDIIEEERFIPRVDYSLPQNFARYGSAQEYYDLSIKRIYQTYPYDGSLKEKLEWLNDSTYLDLYIFNDKYPRTNGYAVLSAAGWGSLNGSITNGYGLPVTPEYIFVKGGPNTNSDEMSPFSLQFTGSNYYEPDKNRASNLEYDLASKGSTVEFWLKKDQFLTSLTEKEVIFDLWNGQLSSSVDYGRLRIELTGTTSGLSPIIVSAYSGTTGFFEQSIAATSFTTASIADGDWHHYAVTFKSASAGVTTRFYFDGQLNNESTLGTSGIDDVDGSNLRAYLGALITTPEGLSISSGAGKLSASLDEFRYWKVQRTSEEIGRFWFSQVGGGVNSDPRPFTTTEESANVDLGVYFKFNEGVTGVTSTDAVVLDYSGRVSNGAWTGYTTGSRNTGSAIISSSAAISEFEDPIVYSFHPDVVSLVDELDLAGSAHDAGNNASIYNSIPSWITEEDAGGQQQLKNLTQILSSYFDTLHLQVNSLNSLKDIQYPSGSNKPLPFAEKLLSSYGFVAPEIFLDADILEKLADRSETKLYEKSLHDVKNIIYQNIYNNLSYIYKSKGTEKAFRNLIRCFGIDDELVKLNMYADNIEYELKNNRRNIVVADKFINFNTGNNLNAVVYNFQDVSNVNSVGFITSSSELTGGYAFTLETEILFPQKPSAAAEVYFDTNAISSSLFGIHGTNDSGTDTTWPSVDGVNFQVLAVRDELNSDNVRFVLTGTAGGFAPLLSSSLYQDVYTNSRWNLSVRIKPIFYPLIGLLDGINNKDYIIELHGVQAEAGEILNSFTISGTIPTPNNSFITGSRRAFVGAHRTNFSGTVLQTSDVKVNSCRYWLDYVEDEVLSSHILDTENHGALQPHLNAYGFNPSSSNGDISKLDTLVFNWEFLENTGSDSNGEFIVEDISSGSAAFTRFGLLGDILNKQYTATGYGFTPSSTSAVDKDFVVSSKLNLPEHVYSQDMVSVLSAQEQDVFTSESRPINYFFAFEKSMYQVISEEMLNYFANLKDFHGLIGEPVNQFRPEYKQLKSIRHKFFEKVGNEELDFDKFYEFYKWFDTSLSVMLAQLVPASADFADNVRTIIEDHVLERSKYQRKFPFLEKIAGSFITASAGDAPAGDMPATNATVQSNTSFTKRQIGSSNPVPAAPWKFLHAPVPLIPGDLPPEDENLYWHKLREERQNADRTGILSAIKQTYERRIGSPMKFSADSLLTVGGVTRHQSNRPNYVFAATSPWGPVVPSTNIPINVMVSFDTDVERLVGTDDVFSPVLKQRLGFGLDPSINVDGEKKFDGNSFAPFSLYSSSVTTGYNTNVVTLYKSGTMITNLHDDFVNSHDRSLQGPFTEKFVGGRFYRHTEINDGTDTRESRAEGFRVELGILATSSYSGALGVVPPNYPFGDSPTGSAPDGYLPALPHAHRFRDETAKRPLNIKNILMTTASADIRLSGSLVHAGIGNYQRNYEVIQTSGRTTNDPYFNDQSFSFASSPETLATRGRFPLASSTENVGGLLDYELPDRTGANSNKTVIVNKFSSPGSFEVMSRGYEDPSHEELSVYNALPYRNQRVVSFGESGSDTDSTVANSIVVNDRLNKPRGLNQLSSLHAGQFGFDPIFGSLATIDQFPSFHKTNANRVRRIMSSSAGLTTGSVYDNLFVQHTIPQSEQQYSWITASLSSGSIIYGLDQGSCYSASSMLNQIVSASDYTSGDFVGLQTLVIDPVTASSHIVGFPLATSSGSYINEQVIDIFNQDADYFNVLMLNRNGPYGYPMWKQIRTGDSNIARSLRNSNLIGTVIAPTKVGLVTPRRPNTFIDFFEPPVENAFSTVNFFFEDNSEESDVSNNFGLSTTFGNNLEYFNHDQLNDYLGLTIDPDSKNSYKVAVDYTINSNLSVVVNHSQRIYPSNLNAYDDSIRTRTLFDITNIWDATRATRSTTSLGTGSMGQVAATMSVWLLDGHSDFTTVSSVGGFDGSGELLNGYSRFSSSITDIIAAPTYTTRIIAGTTAVGSQKVLVGDAEWLAPLQAGKDPYTGYASYAERIRLIGKDHSIVPEFRISELMNDYVELNENDFLTEISNIFDLTGAAISDSSQNNFFKTYNNSDFMKYFRVIDDDLNEKRSGDLKIVKDKISLKCSAILKFLPYKGFYPAERTLELATLFSQSYAESLQNPINFGVLAPPEKSFRVILEPLFAPGILFNTIKSGIAVSNFVLLNTASNPTQVSPLLDPNPAAVQQFEEGALHFSTGSNPIINLSNTFNVCNGYSFRRVPFEAVYRPESFFNSNNLAPTAGSPIGAGYIYDTSTSGSIPYFSGSTLVPQSFLSLDSFYGNELYKLAMDNFLCETTNMFVDDLASFQSNREDDFGPVVSGNIYTMEMKLYRTIITGSDAVPDRASFEMYSRQSAFGPAIEGGLTVKGTGSYVHVSPPYYGAPGIATFSYTASIDGIPTMQDIFESTTIEYTRKTQYGVQTNVTGTVMHIDSCFNLKERLSEVPNSTVAQKNRWLIQSKFETPVLNFSQASSSTPPASSPISTEDSANLISTKGMWHQYGVIPAKASDGVFVILNDQGVNSLADVVGFSKGSPVRVGAIKKEFKLEEAIVAIPFKTEGNKNCFIKLEKDKRNTVAYNKSVLAMRKYIFPPKFDFTRFETVDPVLMYVFEFSTKFSQQDMADMWQNLPPATNEKFEINETIIEEKELIDSIMNKTSDIKWMVFKVKKRANRDFEKFRRSLVTNDVSGISDSIDIKYSYNWPYDYCSLIELVKIDETVQYASTDLKKGVPLTPTEELVIDRGSPFKPSTAAALGSFERKVSGVRLIESRKAQPVQQSQTREPARQTTNDGSLTHGLSIKTRKG